MIYGSVEDSGCHIICCGVSWHNIPKAPKSTIKFSSYHHIITQLHRGRLKHGSGGGGSYCFMPMTTGLYSFMESRLKLLTRTSLRLSELWSHMWWKYLPTRSKFRRIYHTYWEKNVSNVRFVDKCWKPYIISHTCDPDWLIGVRGWNYVSSCSGTTAWHII